MATAADAIPTVRLGDELSVSAIGYGGMALTSVYGDTYNGESLATPNHCLDIGVTFIDTMSSAASCPPPPNSESVSFRSHRFGRGFLTGTVRSASDLASDSDFRRNPPRFNGDALQANLAVVDVISAVAAEQAATRAGLAAPPGRCARGGVGTDSGYPPRRPGGREPGVAVDHALALACSGPFARLSG